MVVFPFGLFVVVFGCFSGGSLCRPYPPRSLFIFSCGNFEARFWCRHWIVGADVSFSVSLVGDEIYVGENAHDLFTAVYYGCHIYSQTGIFRPS